MKKLMMIPVILTFAACGGNEENNKKAPSEITVQKIEAGDQDETGPVTLTQVLSNEFEFPVTAMGPRLKVEPRSNGSTQTTLTAQYRLPLPGKINPKLDSVAAMIRAPRAAGCKLEVNQFTAPDVSGNTLMTLSGTDESGTERNCMSFLANIYHGGATFHFANVAASGYADGTHAVEVTLHAKPF